MIGAGTAPDDSPIRTADLTKFYGTHLGVEGVTFDVAAGEVVGFLGPNGSGKTTDLRTPLSALGLELED